MKVSAKNFKKFNGEIIDVKKITLLAGENSGGKSSFLKLLLFLKQCLYSGNMNQIHSLRGPYHDFGAWTDITKDHKHTKSISFQIIIDEDEYFQYALTSLCTHAGDDDEKNQIKQQIGNGWGNPVTIDLTIPENPLEYKLRKLQFHCDGIGTLKIFVNKDDGKHTLYGKEHSIELEYVPENGKSFKISTTAGINGFFSMVNATDIHQKGGEELVNKFGVMLLAQNYVDDLLSKLTLINPLNTKPERYVNLRADNIYSNKNFFDETIEYLSNPKSSKLLEIIKRTLAAMDIASDIIIKRPKGAPYGELLVNVNGTISNITDVGYGVGLQIYVLTKTLQRSNSYIILEQPEVHLHPKLQSALIHALVTLLSTNKIIIETHSEHIIRKLQVLAKHENSIKPEDISIYYFKNQPENYISCHKIEETGSITPAFPNGFFDSTYNLSRELLGL